MRTVSKASVWATCYHDGQLDKSGRGTRSCSLSV
jgi:hypothetical protein